MRFFYSDRHDLFLPDGHRFPAGKYSMLRETLVRGGVLDTDMLYPSPFASTKELARAHCVDYIASIDDGTISARAMRRIGFPWSAHISRRARATMGGAIAAAR